MAKSPRWNDLKIGILSTAGVVVAALAVLVFGRVGMLHGSTFQVYVATGAARGVIRGTEVWLDGQKVGLVRNVDFRPASVGAKDRLVLSLKVLRSVQSHVRLDTRVQVRAGTTVIGDQVVYMSSGTARMREVVNGDTIHSSDQVDYEGLSGDIARASKELPAILANVKLLNAQLRSVDGTLGALGVDHSGPEIARLRARTSRLMSRLSASEGTLSLTMSNSDLLMARARRAMAQTDSVRALLGSDQHSLGRFRRDSSLAGVVTRLRTEMVDLQRLALRPDGTVGRLRADSAIVHGIHRDLAALDSLMADMKKHPLRYNPF